MSLPGSRRCGLPPWNKKRILTPPGYGAEDVTWVPIGKIKPLKSDVETWQYAMRAPLKESYPVLILGYNGTQLIDGHHRYWMLISMGWRGKVPAVTKKQKS